MKNSERYVGSVVNHNAQRSPVEHVAYAEAKLAETNPVPKICQCRTQNYCQQIGAKYNHTCVFHVVMPAIFVAKLVMQRNIHTRCGDIAATKTGALCAFNAASTSPGLNDIH